jgi:hypothetical protein
MKRIILILILIAILANFVPIAADDAEGYSCYVIMYTTALKNDTWQKIANHWGMQVATLKAMNRGIKLVEGASIKIAVWTGCPRS